MFGRRTVAADEDEAAGQTSGWRCWPVEHDAHIKLFGKKRTMISMTNIKKAWDVVVEVTRVEQKIKNIIMKSVL